MCYTFCENERRIAYETLYRFGYSRFERKYPKILDIVADARKDSPDVKVVLLGDIYNHGPRNPFPEGYAPMQVAKMLNDSKDFIRVIKGNCDSEVDQMISEFPIESDFQWIGTAAPYFHTRS